eukprot:14624030-Alexandrium_andersonii.AAC.1
MQRKVTRTLQGQPCGRPIRRMRNRRTGVHLRRLRALRCSSRCNLQRRALSFVPPEGASRPMRNLQEWSVSRAVCGSPANASARAERCLYGGVHHGAQAAAQSATGHSQLHPRGAVGLLGHEDEGAGGESDAT